MGWGRNPISIARLCSWMGAALPDSSTFFPCCWLLPRDQPIFFSPSKPSPEAIPEFLFHPFSGFCCFKVMRIHSAAVLVIYSLWGFLERRIWIKWKIPPLFLWHFLRTESTPSIPGFFFFPIKCSSPFLRQFQIPPKTGKESIKPQGNSGAVT